MQYLNELLELVKSKPEKVLVVANGIDKHSIEAASKAVDLGIAKVILTGDTEQINSICTDNNIDVRKFKIFHNCHAEEATQCAVELVRNGKANVLMKGLISTDMFMKIIINKETGILPKGNLLTHIAVISNPFYHKLMFVSDVAIIPLPTFDQKVTIVNYLLSVTHRLGITNPKVAFIAATEKVIEKMPACVDANRLTEYWKQGYFKNSECFGPMALDVALDKDAASIKKIHNPVAGEADCLLFPNIESGNIFYKMNTKMCGAKTAAIVYGTKVPTVLSSRGDSMETKLYSIALAALLD